MSIPDFFNGIKNIPEDVTKYSATAFFDEALLVFNLLYGYTSIEVVDITETSVSFSVHFETSGRCKFACEQMGGHTVPIYERMIHIECDQVDGTEVANFVFDSK